MNGRIDNGSMDAVKNAIRDEAYLHGFEGQIEVMFDLAVAKICSLETQLKDARETADLWYGASQETIQERDDALERVDELEADVAELRAAEPKKDKRNHGSSSLRARIKSARDSAKYWYESVQEANQARLEYLLIAEKTDDIARELIAAISDGSTVSMGSIDSHYQPQISVSWLREKEEDLREANEMIDE